MTLHKGRAGTVRQTSAFKVFLAQRHVLWVVDGQHRRKAMQMVFDFLDSVRTTRGYALAKQLNQEWTTEDMSRAQSPESLSIAADDFIDGLQNVRRKMGIALRAARQDVQEPAA